jgi:sugar-specific transcriptional regulator TrmB
MAATPKLSEETLELLGLTPKDLQVYVALLRLGSAPLRRIAEEANLNRGTTYDALKRLLGVGLASFVDAKRHRYFTGEDPHKLRGLATRREVALKEARLALDDRIPELADIVRGQAHRPAVRYHEGETGVREILQDVLSATERAETKEYRVYSSPDVRARIKRAWPEFTDERIRRGVRVKAVAIGEGGHPAELAKRRTLVPEASASDVTYIFIYAGKTAYVSLDAHAQLFGVLIEDAHVAATQGLIFDALWSALPAAR